MNSTLLRLVGVFAAVVMAGFGVSHAQVMDNPVAVPVTVHVRFVTNGTTQTLNLTWYGETSGSGDDVNWSKAGAGTVDTDAQQINLKPGKTYDLQLSGNSSITSYTLELAGPKGYEFRISNISGSDLIERESFSASNTLGNPDAFKIMIRPAGADTATMQVGESTAWEAEKLIWMVGMGQLKNGESAGAIGMRQLDFGVTAYTPADLYYSPPSTEVSAVYSAGTLRQVNAPQALADIVVTGATSYEIRYYSWKDVTGWNGSVYTTTGSPFVTYEISKPANLNIDIKKTVGSDYWTTRLRYVLGLNAWQRYGWTKNMAADSNSMTYAYTLISQNATTKTIDIGEYGRPLDTNGNYTYSSYDASPVRRTRKTYTSFPWGWELTQLDEGWNGGSALRTTTYEYYQNTYDGAGHYRRLKKINRPDGGSTRYTYHDTFRKIGMVKEVYEPFQDTVDGRKTIYDYTPDLSGNLMLPLSQETQVLGGSYITIGKRMYSYNTAAETRNGEPVRIETIDDYTTSSTWQRTVRTLYREDASDSYLRGQLYSVRQPDGSQSSVAYYTTWIYDYYNGVYVWRLYNVKEAYLGTTAAPSGETASPLSSANGDTLDTVYVIANKSTRTASWTDVSGLTTSVQTFANTSGTSFELMAARGMSYDSAGRILSRTQHTYANSTVVASNTLYDATYASGQLSSEMDATGQQKVYTFDRQGRIEEVATVGFAADTSLGTAEVDAVVERHRYDGAGQQIRQSKVAITGAEAIANSWSYDLAGRLSSKTLDCCKTVSYQYPAADQVRTSNPDGGYTIEDYYRDGTLDNITGDAAVPKYIRSQVVSGRLETWSALINFSVGSPYARGWRCERKDWLGRVVEVEEPLYGSGGGNPARIVQSTYNSSGQLIRTRVTLADLVWVPTYPPGNGFWVRSTTPMMSETFEYHPLGNLKRRGFSNISTGTLDLASSAAIVETVAKFERDASGYWWVSTRTSTYPTDSSSTAILVREQRARVSPDANQLGIQVIVNALGADPTASSTPRTQVTTSVNRSTGLVTETTSFEPRPTADAVKLSRGGLLLRQTDSAGAVVTFDYDHLRRPILQVERGTQKTIRTYEDGSASRVRYVKQDYGAELTILENQYSPLTGRLEHVIRKNFIKGAGQDEHTYYTYTKLGAVDYEYGNGTYPVDYVYNAYGQVTEVHQYRDDPGSNKTTVKYEYDYATGLLSEKRHFSDSTNYKATKFQYNVLDQVSKRTWARSSGTLTATYNYVLGSSISTGLLQSIDYSDTTPDVSYTYDRLGRIRTVTDVMGTRQFIADSSYSNLTMLEEDLSTADTGRYGALTVRYPLEDGTGSTVRGRTRGVTLGTGTGGGFAALQSTVYEYDSTSGRIGAIYPSSSAYTPVKPFTYAYHSNSNLVQSVNMLTTGDAPYFSRSQSFESWRGNRYENITRFTDGSSLTTKANFYTPVLTWQHQIETWRLVGGDLSTHYGWSANADVRHAYDTRGQVTGRDYTFIGSTDSLEESYGFDTAGNPTSFKSTSYSINALNQIQPSGGGFVYDDDGNQTEDPEWSFTYDAENRLTRIVSKSVNPKHPMRLEFDYDYMHRRVEKRVYNATTGGTLTSQLRFVYHGYNLIAEVGTSSNVLRSFFWGIGRDSNLNTAAAPEALLLTVDWSNSQARWPVYDLQSNIVGTIGNDRAWKSVFKYDAFGGVTKVGSFAENNVSSFRTSTQYTDDETGLVYHTHRYYNPKTGRFINRDPIGEQGGHNLYRYSRNDPQNSWDVLGLCQILIEFDVDIPDWVSWEGDTMVIHGGGKQHVSFWVDVPCGNEGGGGNGGGGSGPGGGGGGGGSGGGGGGGNPGGNPPPPSTPPTTKPVPLDWLRKLCGDKAGRAIVEKFAKGTNTARISDLIAAGFSPLVGGFNYRGDVFVGSDLSGLHAAVSNATGYTGTVDQLQFAVFYEEGIESMGVSDQWVTDNNPSNPRGYPNSALSQAASEMLTDDFLKSVGDPARFPRFVGRGYNRYLTWRGPPQQRQMSVTASAAAAGATPSAGYGLKGTPTDVQNAINHGEVLSGWDCSRVGM